MANTKKPATEKEEAVAPKTTAESAPKKAPKEKTYTESEMREIVAQELKKALAELQLGEPKEAVLQVLPDENVILYYFGVTAPGAPVIFGKLGQFNKAGMPLDIPKREFFKGMDYSVSKLLETRVVIVASGLTDEERIRYGLYYEDGEVLTQDEFFSILKYDEKKLTERFKKLCDTHKKVVLDLYANDLFENGGRNTTLAKAKALRKIVRTKAPRYMPLVEYMISRLGTNAAEEE